MSEALFFFARDDQFHRDALQQGTQPCSLLSQTIAVDFSASEFFSRVPPFFSAVNSRFFDSMLIV